MASKSRSLEPRDRDQTKNSQTHSTIKNLEADLYSAKKNLDGDAKNNTEKTIVKAIEGDIKVAKEEQNGNGSLSGNSLHVNICWPNGSTRSATGSSSRSGGRTMTGPR